MAKQRIVKQVFWDKKYIRSLAPVGKLLYLYLFTGPLANVSGSYEITIDRMVWDTGLTEIEAIAWLDKFAADDKVIFKNDWICVLNTIEHQQHTTPTIRSGITEQVKCSPDWVKHSLSIRYDWLSHLNLNLNSNLNSNSKNGETPRGKAAAIPDPVERRIWNDGVELLTRTGSSDASARSLLGRLARDHGPVALAQGIAATQAVNAADPKTYLLGVLRPASKRPDMQVGRNDWVCPACGRDDGCLDVQACSDWVKARAK
ncbi:MAG TPA: hypothetical protein VJL58_00565 [Pyrinomonadaceae bacterium]|nr:hypothetical protein [Pyrinomonadaceae bacterium]